MLYLHLIYPIMCTEKASRNYQYALDYLRKAALLLPDDPEINELLVVAQCKLHPAFSVQWIEPASCGTFMLMNTTGETVQVEAYMPSNELDLTLLDGVRVKVLPRPVGWPRRPLGGFIDDSEGVSGEDTRSWDWI